MPALMRDEPAILAPIGLLDVGANALYATATGAASDAIAGVVGSLYPMATVLLAIVVLRERPAGTQAPGALTTLAAVALVGAAGGA